MRNPFQLVVTAAVYPPFGTVGFAASTSTSSRIAKSAADLAIGPAESHTREMGTIPVTEIRPTVGLSAYSAALFAGRMRDPCVSVPRASGA